MRGSVNPSDLVASLPPWLLLSLALGGCVGASFKALAPRARAGLGGALLLSTVGVTLGHLAGVVGDLQGIRLGDLRLLPALAVAVLLLLVAKRTRVC
jgi:hypothetical protein